MRGSKSLLLLAIIGLASAIDGTQPISTDASTLSKVVCGATPGPLFRNLKGPFPTNSWWTGLGVGDQKSFTAGPFPYQAQAQPKGLTFALPQKRDFDGTSVHQYYAAEITVGPSQLSSSTDLNTYAATGFDELTVSLQWSSNGKTFNSYLVQGSPYMTFEYNGLTPQISVANNEPFTSVNGKSLGVNVTDTKFKITTSNTTWVVYLLGSSATLQSTARTLTFSSVYNGVIRIAKLKSNDDEAVLDRYSAVYAKSATINYQVTDDVATLRYNYVANRDTGLLLLTWPHHRDVMDKNSKWQSLQYLTIKGWMKAVESNSIVMKYPLTKIKWAPLKDLDPSCVGELTKSLEYEIGHATSAFPNEMYFWGGAFGRLSRLALIAEQLNRKDLLATILETMRQSFEPWLNGKAGSPPAYETSWGGIVSSHAATNPDVDFGNGYYNDHHFHYGYHLYGASVIGKFDPAWFARAKPYLTSLARDIGNPSSADPHYTVARHKDWFAGHSWASGVANNAGNRNEESTSEAINGYYGLYAFAMVTNDQRLIDFSRLLLATEIQSSQRYWHIKDHSDDPSYVEEGYRNLATAGNLMSDASGQWLWWGNQRSQIAAIQILPLTPITAEVVDPVWGPAMYEYTSREYPDPNISDDWKSIIYAAHATWDAPAAYKEASGLSSWGSGNSNTNTLHFIASRGTNGICATSSVPKPPTFGQVTLKSKSNGQYVDGASTPKVNVGADKAGKFKIDWMPGGYTIKSNSTKKYVSGGNGGTVTAGTDNPQGWESFQFVQSGSFWAIVANSNKKYVELQDDGTLKTTGSALNDRTLFTLTSDSVEPTKSSSTTKQSTVEPTPTTVTPAPVPTNGAFVAGKYTVKLLSNGKSVKQQDINYGRLVLDNVGTVFDIQKIKDNWFSIKSKNNQYVTADDYGRGPLAAARDQASGWESFAFEAKDNGWLIKAQVNGQYVTATASDTLVPTSTASNDRDVWSFTPSN